MNRRSRRHGIGLTPDLAALGCPDCDSDVQLADVAPAVYQGHVAHDLTCPWLADFEARGGHGVRFLQ